MRAAAAVPLLPDEGEVVDPGDGDLEDEEEEEEEEGMQEEEDRMGTGEPLVLPPERIAAGGTSGVAAQVPAVCSTCATGISRLARRTWKCRVDPLPLYPFPRLLPRWIPGRTISAKDALFR